MKKNNPRVLGIMSGTSLDGVDVALLEFKKDASWSYKIVMAETISYSKEWQQNLAEAVYYSESRLTQLNEDYTQLLSAIIRDFIHRHQLKDLDAVCSHGHTIKHEPQNGFTLQIGNLQKLATLTENTVVCDFRVQDVALGGQGAPLVPIGDELLFQEYDYCLNLGGFANISTNRNGKRMAYDICAVNTVMNQLSEKLGLSYDKGGEIAASGSLELELLKQLEALEFYRLAPPKSLGIEWVNLHIFPLLKERESSLQEKEGPGTTKQTIASLLHTYVLHIAAQIAQSLDNDPNTKVLVTGGGAFNSFLMKEIQKLTKCQIIIPSPEVVNYKEALIFGFLGVLKLREEINVLGSVTGASKDHSSGMVFHP